MNTTTKELRVQADTLTHLLFGARNRAADEPGNAELQGEVAYLDGKLEEVLAALRAART